LVIADDPTVSPDRGEVSSPLVTVVVPAYNVRAHIERTISSLRRQSLRNIEVLVVDDCSTDDTRAVVTQAAGGDPRIRILSTGTNSGGVGEPRNVGLREARGSYVMFVDGDDELDRHALRRMAAEATAHDADLVCARMV